MKRLLVGIVLLAVACSSGTGGDSGAVPDAAVTFAQPLRAGSVTWTIVVTNDTGHTLDLTFSSGQRGDVTLQRGKDVVYRWSAGQMFTQVVGHVRVKPGLNTAFKLEDPDFHVEPGEYQLVGVVTTSDATTRRQLRSTQDVTVSG